MNDDPSKTGLDERMTLTPAEMGQGVDDYYTEQKMEARNKTFFLIRWIAALLRLLGLGR